MVVDITGVDVGGGAVDEGGGDDRGKGGVMNFGHFLNKLYGLGSFFKICSMYELI